MPGSHQTAHDGATELVLKLTEREREVLKLIATGLTSDEIAGRLHRSIKTVETHRCALGRKLHARNRVELTRTAIEAGLVDPPTSPSPVIQTPVTQTPIPLSTASGQDPAAERVVGHGVNMSDTWSALDRELGPFHGRAYLQQYVDGLRGQLGAGSVVIEVLRGGGAEALQIAAAGLAAHPFPYASDRSPAYALHVGEIRIWDAPFPAFCCDLPWTIGSQTVSMASTMILGPDGMPLGAVVVMSAKPICDVRPLRCFIRSGQQRIAQEIAAALQE